jgi:hypothetical protein
MAVAICGSVTAAEEQGVVVLRSGGVLHGKVSVSGERYVVTQPKSVVDVPALQVLLVANSMDDAYQRQRQQLPHDSTEAHLGLAEWCLRYNLLQAAEQELADARRLDPRDLRVALLERRLAVARQPRKLPTSEVAAMPHDDSPSKEELQKLDAFAKELPPGVVERFARKVQPLLVNNCTTSGCHQPEGQQEFQLDRAVLHGLSNRRITLRNLIATLELVDRDAPQHSDLLSIPRRTHGGMSRPILGPRQETQLTQLVDWVGLVTETSVATEPVAALPDGEASIQSLEPFGRRGKPSHFLDRDVAPANFDEPQQPLRPKGEVKFGADLRPWQPKDEFDPEIFNRLNADPATPSATTAVGPPAAR